MRQFKAEDWFGCLSGQDVVVMGLGPSLRSVQFDDMGEWKKEWKPHRCWTIGVNNIEELSSTIPDFLVVIDPAERLRLGNRWEFIENSESRVVFYNDPLPIYHPVQARIDLHTATHNPVAGMNTPTGIPSWKHTPHVAAALAVRMGATRVFFIGVDLNDPKHATGQQSKVIVDGMRLLKEVATLDYGCSFHTLTKESALADIMRFAEAGDVRPKYLQEEQDNGKV